MGAEVLTLAEVWPKMPLAMIVGLNPVPSSVAAGHYYQGHVVRRQLMRLVGIGAMAAPTGTHFEQVAADAGIGFTDLVRRPSVGEKDVKSRELADGRAKLESSLANRSVPLIVCIFRHPVRALLCSDGAPGFQTKLTSWGASVFRMPGPRQRREKAAEIMATLTL
jgi:TDG/mug DNA glycosylase family protein